MLKWFCVASIWLPNVALAGGYIVSEMGSRASGRAGAATALIDSPSAVFFNPANVAMLDGLQVELGAAFLAPRWSFTSSAEGSPTTTSDAAISVPPALSLTYQVGNFGFGDIGVGLGVYVPYGASFTWPDNWEGRSELQGLTLQGFEVSPVLSWRPHKMVAIGGGFRYMPASVYMRRAVSFGSESEGAVELGGRGTALGASAGISVFPMDGLSVGLSWRSRATFNFTGDSNFEFPPPFDTQARDGSVLATLPAPQVFRLGLAYDVLPELNISLDLEYQMWSAFESLDITFTDDLGESTVSSPRNARSTLIVHVGGEYRINEAFAVRAGYAYDPYIIPENFVSPAPPDSDRHLVSLGASYHLGAYGVHGHVGSAFFTQRQTSTNSMPGTWRGGWPGGAMALIAGLTLSASFGVAEPALVADAQESDAVAEEQPSFVGEE